MAEHQAAPPLDNPEVSHETSDIDLRPIAMWSVALVILVVMILALLLWLFGHFSKREDRLGHRTAGVPASAPVTAAPQLQISPRSDMAEMRAAEEKTLRSYGWVDKQKGVARIPIERAMELLAERAAPAKNKK
jgi:hypothetical protein